MNNDNRGNGPNGRHTYREVGFNRFFRRSINSNPNAVNLNSVGGGATRQLKFDDMQVSGALGDILRIGRISLDGKLGRESIYDERNNEVLRLGDIGDE